MPETINRWATAIIVVVVVLIGGVAVLVDDLPFREYLEAVAIGAGLLGVGYGLDARSRP